MPVQILEGIEACTSVFPPGMREFHSFSAISTRIGKLLFPWDFPGVCSMLNSMSADGNAGKLADAIAEEVLRTIYGDDYAGCKVAPAQIASIIAEPIVKVQAGAIELLELYDRVMEAILLLSTPPGALDDPQKLGALLSERLDTIHSVVKKTIETTTRFKEQRLKTRSEEAE